VFNLAACSQINHTDGFQLAVLTTVTLARSNSALPDDCDCTETFWSCFNVNFNTPFKKTCASVGVKTLIVPK
jgi:hypothetical protein